MHSSIKVDSWVLLVNMITISLHEGFVGFSHDCSRDISDRCPGISRSWWVVMCWLGCRRVPSFIIYHLIFSSTIELHAIGIYCCYPVLLVVAKVSCVGVAVLAFVLLDFLGSDVGGVTVWNWNFFSSSSVVCVEEFVIGVDNLLSPLMGVVVEVGVLGRKGMIFSWNQHQTLLMVLVSS